MERILFISDSFPFPINNGGRVRTANIIMQLSKEYEIDLVSFARDQVYDEDIKKAESYCASVFYSYGYHLSKRQKLMNVFSKTSNNCFKIFCDEIENQISLLLSKNQYKYVWLERIYSFVYFEKKEYILPKLVINTHDVDREAKYRFLGQIRNPFKKAFYYLEYLKIIELEKKAFDSAQLIMTVSNRDKKVYSKFYPNIEEKLCIINNGIDLNNAKITPVVKRLDKNFLFVGSLGYVPNLEGIKWFVANVWPKIYQVDPEMKLTIVGSGTVSEADMKALSVPGIDYLGYVEDIYSVYRKYTGLIVPIFSGSGTRIKILEAFALKIPVISTTLGCEGLNVVNRKELVIADSPNEMCDAVFAVATKKELCNDLSEEGYKFVEIEYNWDIIGKSLRKLLN